jgi:hypothetical protein
LIFSVGGTSATVICLGTAAAFAFTGAATSGARLAGKEAWVEASIRAQALRLRISIQLTAPYQREINNVEFEPLNAKIQDDFAHLGSADRFQRQGLALQRYRSSIKETTKVA